MVQSFFSAFCTIAHIMNLLRNLSIRTKLFLISLLPTLGLIFLLANSINESLAEKEDALDIDAATERVEHLSSVIHALQTERAYYLSYLASRSERDLQRINDQLPETDAAVSGLAATYRRHGVESPLFEYLDSLSVWRQDFNDFPNKANEAKSAVLMEVYDISRLSAHPEIKNHLEAHRHLLYTKEYFSRTRNLLFPFFIEKSFSDSLHNAFVNRVGQFALSEEKFLLTADEELVDRYRRGQAESAYLRAQTIIQMAIDGGSGLTDLTDQDWWNLSTPVTNLHVEMEKLSLNLIRTTAGELVNSINQKLTANIATGLIALTLIVSLLAYTIRQIIIGIAGIKEAAQKLAQGEVEFSIDIHTKDELGDLAEAFNQMIAVQKSYAHAAERIGMGEYDTPVVVRSESDTLGHALNRMKTNLSDLSRENERRTWLLTGTNLLNDKMRGEKDVPVLASDVITQVAELLEAQVGTLYVRENGHMRRVGGYAHTDASGKDRFAPGEGLVGQVAVSRKHILLPDVPDDYLTITSGLGQTRPRNIIVYPLTYENEVKGVLELASARTFSPRDLELLSLVESHIGIAIHASQSRQTLKELLEETQRQSEELEAQQEELRQFNEELLVKTNLLEKSEEELKAQQEELQMSNEELVEKAALLEEQKQNLEFTKLQLEAKAQELELASQYKSEFLSNMSHELRTPLNSILILAQVLMENRNKSLTSKEIKFASTIYNSGNDLLNLINEILDLSRIEAGKMDLDIQSFALDSMVQNLSNAFDELARSKKLKFDIVVPAAMKQKVLISDGRRIEQVLKNFLSNSFKFTPAGGQISLIIDRPAENSGLKRKSLISHPDVIAFTVKDTGIGIPSDKLSSIFEAFQQVDGSTKRKYGGTGLGLSISRELANLLGGEIHASSRWGEGSSFTLFIPAELHEEPQSDESDERTLAPEYDVIRAAQSADPVIDDASHYDDQHLITEGDRKILIMEDDVAFARLLLDFVHERNYKGIIAHQGNVGLSYARHYKPDAIILDMKLPVIDGEEVLRKLKADPELRHIPVQIISGYDYRRTGLELGAIDYIKKPVSREGFWKALDKVERFVSRKPKKLLIIEDDQQHNEAVKELIGNGDVKCYSAYSGTEGFDMLRTTSFDCIIVDLGLPDMPGLEFLEKLRELNELNRIPVIVYTGKDLSREENKQLEKLANTVVLKTAFSNERLLDETTLFLHRVESKLPKEKQQIIRKLHKSDEVLRGKRVLIVDDDDRNVYSLQSALEPEGAVCTKALNGREAVNLVQEQERFDIILMDVMMPEMDGFEATRAIRKIADYQKVPIIALTAKAMKDDRQKCLTAGMSDYISKPLNVQQLLSLMRVWLYT